MRFLSPKTKTPTQPPAAHNGAWHKFGTRRMKRLSTFFHRRSITFSIIALFFGFAAFGSAFALNPNAAFQLQKPGDF